ncbi:hypothetical protein KFE25_010274 [Diacronema lutheri]|uniref:Uncharacterized protein n=1 Tax=Diacronema lutheri TaxID=2081491 RepID=A0A8J5XDJ0_DIALT|nr:hypothetical protein KFE25_010274 [Diacronema lutheri]|mmetsp:Transcript_4148/g.12869  ORF Transcript_4148/g.12869 Transcript_4148/m.12869 type:complete len:222 (-) Transcript_4148:65-730(-)
MSSFDLAVGGRLKLKGDDSAGEKKRKKSKRRDDDGAAAAPDVDGGDDGRADNHEPAAAEHWIDGTGTVQTSGTIVMGRETRFTEELAVDDSLALTVVDRFRGTSEHEARRVRMVVGDGSASLEAPFSCDVTERASFRVLKARPSPELVAEAAAKRAAERKRQRRDERLGELVTYEKLKAGASAAGGVWKTTVKVTERLGPGQTREDVLNFRAKLKSDKHCK